MFGAFTFGQPYCAAGTPTVVAPPLGLRAYAGVSFGAAADLARTAGEVFAASAVLSIGTAARIGITSQLAAAATVSVGTAANFWSDFSIECEPGVDVIFAGQSTWTSLLPDLLAERGISATRGMSGTGPTDRVCQPGTMEFTLRNDAGNSGQTASWYSPTHPQVRPGWKEGIPIRLTATYKGTVYPLWSGRIRTIDPTPGPLPMRVAVLAQDAAGDLATATPRTIPPQINRSETQLLQAVFDALEAEARPPTNLDTALDTFTFAFDNTSSEAVALSLIYDTIMSCAGTAYVNKSGTFVYRNRQHQAATDPALDIAADDLLYSGPGFVGASSLRNVFNHFFLTLHQKVTSDPGTPLFKSDVTFQVDPGKPVEVWDDYADPDNPARLVGGYNFVLPVVATTDYQAFDNEDGTGTNRTNDITVTVEAFISTAKTTVTNTSATSLFVTFRQLRGTAIYDNNPTTMESFTAKPYGDRAASIDLPFQDNVVKTQLLADMLVAQYSDRARAGEEVVFDPQRRIPLMAGAMSLDIGDVVTASEPTSGVFKVAYEIRGVTYSFAALAARRYLTMRYRIVPHVTGAPGSNAWIFDHPVYGLLDSGTIFGFV